MKNIIKGIVNQKTFSLKSDGSSMMPILQPNDVIYYKKTSFKQTKVNNLVMVKKNNQLFTHRVIYKKTVFKKDSLYLITKGDNNLTSDGKIYPKQIIAKVTSVKRSRQLINPDSIYLLQSTLYFVEIVKIKKVFEREKIDFVFLKGLPLHLYYEKSHPRRVYLDCDVLVNPKDFTKAEKVIIRYGYKKAQTELSPSHKSMKDKEVENTYYKAINGFQVVFDLHVEVVFMMTQLGKLNTLYPQKLIDQLTEEFLRTKRIVRIQSEPFLILHSSFLILYLALHFFHHNFRGAFRLDFLDTIIRKVNMQPTTVKYLTVIIKIYHLQNFVYPVLVLLKKYYHTPIPSQFLKAIRPSSFVINYLESRIYHLRSIFDDESRITAGINRFKNLFFLSPRPLWRRFLVFANPQVILTILWVFYRRLANFTKMLFKPIDNFF